MSLRNRTLKMLMVAGLVAVCACGASASVIIETVPVGNPGNTGELSDDGAAPPAIVGGVAYSYNIAKHEVTAGQYTEFLNAVADTDTYGLWHPGMQGSNGTHINRTGSPGSYTYTMGDGTWANRPVHFVNWGDSARFANWMHNGQPTGAQGLGTTEDGSYFVNGAMSEAELDAVSRKADATWVIPTEDEWYKAAYHKNDGATNHYWAMPMGINALPNNGNPGGDTGNTANFYDGIDYTIGLPYLRTNVGFFGLSDSPYGTFDQGGNVSEWNETRVTWTFGLHRGLRGGSCLDGAENMSSHYRDAFFPSGETYYIGFRLALVPEPATIVMLALAGAGIRRRKRA